MSESSTNNNSNNQTSENETSKSLMLNGDDMDQSSKTTKEELYSSPELEKYWKAVKDNPADFTGWTYLLQYVEQQRNLDAAREAFDAFLARYPYCYGYWKKYTDLEKKHDNFSEAEEVFERGVKAIPLSIDLWLHYISFINIKYREKAEQDSKKRHIFDRAVTSAGTDFRSDKLWEAYINWEKEKNNTRHVGALYDKLTKVPTLLYKQHTENFKKLINDYHPKRVVGLDEFLQLRREDVKPTTAGLSEEDADAAGASADEAPPGLEPEQQTPVGDNDTKKESTDKEEKSIEDSEIPQIREKILEKRSLVFQANEQEVSKRWKFEEKIRRPYFHVKPLEKGQLRNWREYLDFEMEQGSHERIVILFERCLIACALYEEFWLKYVGYMRKHSADAVRNIFRRACEVHLPKKSSMHLAWAAFEETQGNMAAVAKIFDKLDKAVPGLVVTSLRRIGVARRQSNSDATLELYRKFVTESTKPEEKAFFSIKYALYLAKVLDQSDQAREVLEEALKNTPNNAKLMLQLIELTFSRTPVDVTALTSLFDRAIAMDVGLEQRVAFSQRKLEFLEDFGSDITQLTKAYDDHDSLSKEMQSKKRKAQDDVSNEAAKRQKGEPSAAPTATTPATAPAPAAAPSQAPPASSGYSQQTTTADNSAYSQAAYNAYYQNYYAWSGYQQSQQQQQSYYSQS